MTCERYTDRLLECVGGKELPTDLAGHLPECEACRRAWTELTRLSETLAAGTDLSLSDEEIESLARAVDQRIRQHEVVPKGVPTERPARSFPGWPRLFAAAAGVALVIGVGTIGYKMGRYSEILQVHTDSSASASVLHTSDFQSSVVDESDIEGLLSDYAQNHSSGISNQLLDDISDDELEYLQTNLNVEGLL